MITTTPVTSRVTLNWKIIVLGITGLVVVLAVARVVTGANDITSGGTIGAALALAVPIGMAALGGLWSERSGIINIGLEGMMILGTWFGAWGALITGNAWAGVVAGVAGGALGGLLHAVATVTFGVDHIVSGVAINIIGLGVTQYLSKIVFASMDGGGDTQSPRLPSIEAVGVPFIGPPLKSLEGTHIFLLADVAGVVRGLLTGVSLLTIVAVVLVPFTFLMLWRTSFGLRLRSCGESPVAAESLGVNVYLYKYAAVTASGAFAGLGGAFLAIVASGIYREGQTGGRGFIGLAAMIFGNWRPSGVASGALLFGYTDALQLRQGGTSVHALLLAVALLIAGVAVYQLVRLARTRAALISGAAAVVILVIFAVTDSIPEQFTSFTPHLTTLLVLSVASQRLRPAATIGQPYRRGDGG